MLKNAAENKKDAVEQVLRVLMKDEVGIALAQASGCAPARENCYSYEEVSGDEVVMAMKETAENAVPMPNLPEMDVMWTVASGLLTDVNMAGNASSADQTTASENTGTSDTAASTDVHPDNASAARTTIRDLINAPETYKSQVTDDTSKLVVNTDAAVEIPDVEKISAISVTPAAVTQDLLDGITDAFFSNAKIYTADSYYVQTKDEIKKKSTN